jgi:hypothetical protein
MITIKLGLEKEYYLGEPLDTWLSAGLHDYPVPEASGSSARVFNLKAIGANKLYDNMAFKVMRHDKIAYASPLFIEELKILSNLPTSNILTPMLGSGFIKVDSHAKWPEEIAPLSKSLVNTASASALDGECLIYSPNETENVLNTFSQYVSDGWLPFILLEKRWEDNLYLLCDAGYTRGAYIKNFTVLQILDIAIQITDLMVTAHQTGAVYLDHKLLHYYWNGVRNRVRVIDWNIGRWNPEGLAAESTHFDILQFCARALHHLFTGRQAPGSVAVGPNKKDDIDNAPHQYKASFHYDVQKRLNKSEMSFLEKALAGEFHEAGELLQSLKELHKKRL